MTSSKKDLTRIEDLSEYFHEDENTDGFQDENPENSDDENVPYFDQSLSFTEEKSFNEIQEDYSENSSEESFENTSDDSFENSFGKSYEDSSDTFSEDTFENSFENSSESSFENIHDIQDDLTNDDSDNDIQDLFEKDDDLRLPDETPPVFHQEENSLSRVNPDEPPVWEPLSEKTSLDNPQENLQELRDFSEHSRLSSSPSESNPSFSVVIKEIKYLEDAEDVLLILKELDLLWEDEKIIESRLQRGHLIVPRISEFAATMLLHKLRRFNLSFECGPSDFISNSSFDSDESQGLLSQKNILQNRAHHFEFEDRSDHFDDIILTTTSQLEGYEIIKYNGLAIEQEFIHSSLLEMSEIESTDHILLHYQGLSEKLKAHALKSKSNAIVSINFQLTSFEKSYHRLTCSGTMVQVKKHDTN